MHIYSQDHVQVTVESLVDGVDFSEPLVFCDSESYSFSEQEHGYNL